MAASHAATRCAATVLLASLLILISAVPKGEGGAPPAGPDAARAAGNPMDCMVGCAKQVIGYAKETMECAAGCGGQGSAVVDVARLLRDKPSMPIMSPACYCLTLYKRLSLRSSRAITASQAIYHTNKTQRQATNQSPAEAMPSARATTRRYATVVALASLILLLVAAPFFVAAAAADADAATTVGGEPDPADAARDNRKMLDCTMRCVTEAMGCATRCASARADEAPVCAAACVQGDIGCLAGCGLQQPVPGGSPPALTPPPPAK
ncbi:hypothetical protein BAE44_0002055 [Dichanthelium oligosanthes]|uniref:Bifunctional inhibitor/plant lipid transfer protein/seed storage helical domain-containing protein n=1 Tax=Dichanthelium oligosanthes TaxID=888268 RepID=A0A1E5WIG8_9POAL|nr:hypothetical protein BAE44_0002055 [Dichanthelium oligosanthes]